MSDAAAHQTSNGGAYVNHNMTLLAAGGHVAWSVVSIACMVLLHAVHSKLDYCNAVLSDLLNQHTQNTTLYTAGPPRPSTTWPCMVHKNLHCLMPDKLHVSSWHIVGPMTKIITSIFINVVDNDLVKNELKYITIGSELQKRSWRAQRLLKSKSSITSFVILRRRFLASRALESTF